MISYRSIKCGPDVYRRPPSRGWPRPATNLIYRTQRMIGRNGASAIAPLQITVGLCTVPTLQALMSDTAGATSNDVSSFLPNEPKRDRPAGSCATVCTDAKLSLALRRVGAGKTAVIFLLRANSNACIKSRLCCMHIADSHRESRRHNQQTDCQRTRH